MTKTSKLRALASFDLMLGEEANHYSVLKKWLRYENSLQGILQDMNIDGFTITDGESRVDDSNYRFFITAHYGIYPLALFYLSRLFPDKKLVCLVGKQRAIQNVKGLAEKYNVDADFLEVGDSFIFIRKCIRAAKKGAIFISFFDIPIGLSKKDDTMLDFFNGKIRAKDGLFKLSEKLNLPCCLLFTGLNKNNDVPIDSYHVNSHVEAFKIFEKHVAEHPYLWDKVLDLHYFYQPSKQDNTFIPFKLDKEYFVLSVDDNKVMRINSALYGKICSLKSKDASNVEAQECKNRIYEQTKLLIGNVL